MNRPPHPELIASDVGASRAGGAAGVLRLAPSSTPMHAPPQIGSPTAAPAASKGISLQTFSALRHGGFRLLWIGTVCTTIAQFLQAFTLSWLAYERTGSAAIVGIVVASTAVLALIVGPLAGVLSDRFDRRKLGMIGQGVLAASAMVLALLVGTGVMELWHLLAYGLISGAAWSLIHPVRHALTPMTVPRTDLLNAVALNSMALHSSRLIAPVLGGILVGAVGIGANFGVLAAASLIALATFRLLGAHPAQRRASDEQSERASFAASFVAGLRYIRHDQTVCSVLLLGMIVQFLLLPTFAIVPVFAIEMIGAGPEVAGFLFGVSGIGALVATFVLASLGNVRHKGAALLGTAFGVGVALALCSLTSSLLAVAAFLVLVGVAHGTFFSLNNALLQANTADAYRGRVTSISTLNQSAVFLGGLLVGPLAARVGSPATFAAMGVAIAGISLWIGWRVPRLRSLS